MVGGCNYRGRSEYVRKAAAGLRKWDVSERTARRRSPATKTTLQTPTLRVCAWTAHVHRVGRTAQYAKGGHALLVLALKARGIEIPTFKIRPSKTLSIEDQLQRLAFLAQQALVSRVRSVHLHHDKAVFKLEALPVESFATSLLGLAAAPKIRLLSRAQAKCTTCPTCCIVGNEEDLPSSGSANDSDERGSDVEDLGTSQDEREQGKVTKVCPFYLSHRTPNLYYSY